MSTEQETNIKTRAGNMSDARVGITGCAWSGCQGAVTPLQREVHQGLDQGPLGPRHPAVRLAIPDKRRSLVHFRTPCPP